MKKKIIRLYVWTLEQAEKADVNEDSTSSAAFYFVADRMQNEWPDLKEIGQ